MPPMVSGFLQEFNHPKSKRQIESKQKTKHTKRKIVGNISSMTGRSIFMYFIPFMFIPPMFSGFLQEISHSKFQKKLRSICKPRSEE